jgi:hypothetical protein
VAPRIIPTPPAAAPAFTTTTRTIATTRRPRPPRLRRRSGSGIGILPTEDIPRRAGGRQSRALSRPPGEWEGPSIITQSSWPRGNGDCCSNVPRRLRSSSSSSNNNNTAR